MIEMNISDSHNSTRLTVVKIAANTGLSSLGVHPDFGRSVNPISTRGDRLCPPNYYWHIRIFRPSDGPAEGMTSEHNMLYKQCSY